ncbi:lisH domain-containing protein FOPNL-like [Pomacea canaliculata]|uniref:lisH domain-containing protein FOPNL-like n=1 Tax=Pomacea canaliculata TaxID=400727 RepID=UPI000D736283|nr:lisH domain-containing protein FOPNL-like [Pomacea canaliculata]
MASNESLRDVLKKNLDSRGVLNQVKARIRAEVFNALDRPSEGRPVLSNENILINELIREYFEFNKYHYSASVLVAESGMSKEPLDREFLRTELNVVEDAPSRSVPLLYSIVSNYTLRSGTSLQQQKPRTAFMEQIARDTTEVDGIGPGDPLIVRGGQR